MALVATKRNWEETFIGWAAGPSQTENEKCENAERAIRKAIAASQALRSRDIQVFVQGSYRNKTNARFESDVDVCVRLMDVFFSELPAGVTRSDVHIVDADYTYAAFKNDVGAALKAHFGERAVTRGNKAFDVHENTNRVDADVVAAFEHRRYRRLQYGFDYHSGTELRPDSGGSIINWPQQNYDNGVGKNDRTSRRFKRVVRILKRLRNEMREKGIAAAANTPSYLIECLVWNVPDHGFNRGSYMADVRFALAHLFNQTKAEDTCQEWGEVNELKYLFRSVQPWTRAGANAFVLAAWNYIGFED